jgi:4-hydroxybenzoate polyprenyltransferase
MVDQTYRVILQEPINTDFYWFVFFSTICSYSFHWYLTADSVIPSERIVWIHRYRSLHLYLFVIGLAGSAFFFLQLLDYWHWLLLSAGITFLYSAPKIPHPLFRSLRKVALGKTIFLAMVWMNVTSLLPLLISDQPWQTEFTIFAVSRFFLIYAICILFDYRDRQDDKASGIRSLITYLDEGGIRNLFIFSILVFVVTTIALYWHDQTLLSVGILLVPGLITAALYNYARKNFNDLFYYFVLDGLMAFSAILFLISSI